nr:glycosyltransferase [Chloroflexota bacterium]
MVPNYHVVQISKVRMNPYVRLLQGALREVGISCSVADGLSPRLVRSWREKPAVLHLHWLELLYTSTSSVRSIRLLAAVLWGLFEAKNNGCKIVYTVHNLNPHEQRMPFLGRIANPILFAMADALHVHDEQARLDVARAYPHVMRWREKSGKKTYVVPHGSYIGAYPNQCTREEARARLGLDQEAFVYLFLGLIRPYKGVEDLITAFSQLRDGVCQLVVAGHVHDAAYAETLTRLIQGQAKVHAWFEYVPDSDVQYFMNASDVCVLPYRDVTTSGAAILAFSFGKPVIAPALGGFLELVSRERGILYDPMKADGLLHALQQARLADMKKTGERALAWAREHEWRALVPYFVRMYNGVWVARE